MALLMGLLRHRQREPDKKATEESEGGCMLGGYDSTSQSLQANSSVSRPADVIS